MAEVKAESNVDEVMAMEASANVKTFQQLSNKTMIDLDQMRSQLSSLQDENEQLKGQLSQQNVSIFILRSFA